jgi:aminoglycoside 6'-N-acetyltransferase I
MASARDRNEIMTDFSIRRAQSTDRDEVVAMEHALWPDAAADDLTREFDAVLAPCSAGASATVFLVCQDAGGTLQGFLEVGLRSHADGCDPSRPVGFVEGWLVREAVRHQGIGGALMRAAEDWARAQGCTEIASDTTTDNVLSERAHVALGFEVVDRCVHFRKTL